VSAPSPEAVARAQDTLRAAQEFAQDAGGASRRELVARLQEADCERCTLHPEEYIGQCGECRYLGIAP
jgi:hypothetical protein